MLPAKSLKFLQELMNCSGPSGFEEETAKVFGTYLREFADQVTVDVMGNTIGVINPNGKYRVMLAGHYDEIGFQVVYISDEGLIYFRRNGGIDNATVPGSEVEILTASGRIPGVIGKKPIHLVKSKERDTVLELDDLWIDIGAENKKAALKLVTIGDPITIRSNFKRLSKNRIMSKGMDDKIGAFIVAEVLRTLNLWRHELNVEVCGVGTVQEELGLRGATTSCFDINPKVGFAIDVGFATDIPGISKTMLGEIKLGNGPELNRNADNNPILGRMLRDVAKKHKIKYQEAASRYASGGTDTAQMQMTRAGVATALLSVPNRYMHTPVEICDLRDVESTIDLLVKTISSFTGEESFIPVPK